VDVTLSSTHSVSLTKLSLYTAKLPRWLFRWGSLDIDGDKKSILNKIEAMAFRLLYSEMIEDKRKELQLLQTSRLDWTLVRLLFIKEHRKSQAIKEDAFDMPGFNISSRDIARFMIEQIHNSSYIGKTPFISN